ncbi:DUF87 domain-containing protein [Iodidimonas sp. SYSU 1G8]|uniref:ATP-binding protein n=1 Tax=Iodidimonas sp. SYSU 1G8 TaxID=3133967 RepID=UPI0031FEA732
MDSPRVIGHIVAVQGFRVKVELLPDTKSAMRATLDGVQAAVSINAYVTFSIGAGQLVIGIITDLEARESYDPESGDDLTLELMKPRRIASIQLLGTIDFSGSQGVFSPGITILPTLDTPAEIGAPRILKAVFETPPKRNKPENHQGDDYDCDLDIGRPTGQPANRVKASYNDLFSRPLAIVGNTGSGKSFTVSSILQKGMATLGKFGDEPHIFILDVNGEYEQAFSTNGLTPEKRPDHIYLNGKPFGIPIWFLNAAEICSWLSASEQTQEPVLKDWWALAKARGTQQRLATNANSLHHAISKTQALIAALDANRPKKQACVQLMGIIKQYLANRQTVAYPKLRDTLLPYRDQFNETKNVDWSPPQNEPQIRAAAEELITELNAILSTEFTLATLSSTTADSPRFISRGSLYDPTLIDDATSPEDAGRIEAHLTTLKLRLRARLDDPRWRSFFNYEQDGTKIESLESWLRSFGLGAKSGPRVSVIDLSMLSHEVLPYACTIIGRVLLEARENLRATQRYKHPWVLVLEEAHNYARPPRSDEERGQTLSRLAFERIAKEGRKFGFSLIVASQRPSEISPTIISQCANFVSHRLQNPEDIDHFRRIIPMQARRLLDQVTILASGEAIVFGSAFHVPTRVLFDAPAPGPYSQTAAPFHEWQSTETFPIQSIIGAWGLQATEPAEVQAERTSQDREGVQTSADDNPF